MHVPGCVLAALLLCGLPPGCAQLSVPASSAFFQQRHAVLSEGTCALAPLAEDSETAENTLAFCGFATSADLADVVSATEAVQSGEASAAEREEAAAWLLRESELPTRLSGDAQQAFPLRFGERNCSVALYRCAQTCYLIYDYTSRVPVAESNTHDPPSVFSWVEVENADYWWTPSGVFFRPTTTDSVNDPVVLRYSTHTCADFFDTRASVADHPCGQSVLAISQVEPVEYCPES